MRLQGSSRPINRGTKKRSQLAVSFGALAHRAIPLPRYNNPSLLTIHILHRYMLSITIIGVVS